MPPVRPARYALGREIYQAVTFLSREQEHLLLDRAPHLKTTRWHPNFLDVIPPIGGKDLGMDAILDHFGIPVENCMPSAMEKTTCPCWSTPASAWPWAPPATR